MRMPVSILVGQKVDRSDLEIIMLIFSVLRSKFLQDLVHEHWDVLRQEQLKDPALGFLVMLEKAGSAMT